MVHCQACGVLDSVGESVICEDCADNAYVAIRTQTLKEVVSAVKHLIRQEGYACGEADRILSFLKEMR